MNWRGWKLREERSKAREARCREGKRQQASAVDKAEPTIGKYKGMLACLADKDFILKMQEVKFDFKRMQI